MYLWLIFKEIVRNFRNFMGLRKVRSGSVNESDAACVPAATIVRTALYWLIRIKG
jgi:hypothetical protein